MNKDTKNRAARTALQPPVRVLQVGPGRGQRGGIASVLLELKEQEARFQAAGVSLSFFETRGFQSLMSMFCFILSDLPQFVLALFRGVDVVHFHVSIKGSFYRKFVLWLLAKLSGHKTIFHLHAGNFSQFREHAGHLTRCAVSRFVRHSSATIAVSNEIGKELIALGADPEALHVIGNTARLAELGRVRHTEGTMQCNGIPYVAFAGRLTEVKGIPELLEAVALLKQKGCFVELRLAGDGDVARWRDVARDYGIEDRVFFMGWLDGEAKLEFYRNARVFCMPSHHESFGITTLEAMFSAVAVVGTRLGGFLDLVDEGETGYLVEPRTPEVLASRLRFLVENAQLAKEMGRAGLARAQQRYSVKVIIDGYIHCYSTVARR